MKFKIESTAYYDVNKIIEHYPCLIKFGFEVEKIYKKKTTRIKDENGKIIEFEYDGELEFNPYIHINRWCRPYDCT